MGETVIPCCTLMISVDATPFESHIDRLAVNVLPMHDANGRLQIKQQSESRSREMVYAKIADIQKLIKTIDATVQFYGKTGELELAIR